MATTEVFLQVLVSGVLIGGVYGLFSCGLSLVFGVTRIVNFAHGDFVTVGMYGAIVGVAIGMNPLLSLLPVGAILFGLGLAVYVFALRPSIKRRRLGQAEEFDHLQLVITLGVSLVIENGLQLIFSPNAQAISGFLEHSFDVYGIYINETQLVAFALAVVVFGLLYAAMTRTPFGKAIQATVDDDRAATLVGINTNGVFAVTFAVGAALAGIAGAILATYYPVIPTTGEGLLAIAFAVVVLGGLGSVAGTFLAGVIVGMIQQLTATYVSMDLQNVGIFVAFILFLMFMPQGLAGTRTSR